MKTLGHCSHSKCAPSACALRRTQAPLRRLAAILLVFCALTRGHAQVPALVNYQGRLANPDGSPLPTADYTLTFNVFDAATNGALVWGPQVFDGAVAQGHGARIPVVQGYFNVMLGPVDTTNRALSDAFNGAARYVEVTVSNRPPIAPRQQILTTPFAFQAANSAKLAGYDWSALLGTNNPVAGTIPFSKLAQRQSGTNVGVGGVAISLPTPAQWESPTPDTSTLFVNLDVIIQTTGRPVYVALIPDDGTLATQADGAYIYCSRSGGTPNVLVALLRDSQNIQGIRLGTGTSAYFLNPGDVQFVDLSAAPGSHRYQIKGNVDSSPSVLSVSRVRLIAFEL